MKGLGTKLRELRTARQISQAELSERSGVSLSVICHLEEGVQFDTRLSTICKLSKVLRVPLDKFNVE